MTATQPNYGLILFPNILNSARTLTPEDSDPAILLTALSELRFHGGEPEKIRRGLSNYNLIAFDLLAEKLIRSMNSYKAKCARSSNTCSSDTDVIGGGMYLDDDDLCTLAYATEGTETENYFYALYQVHSGEADMDTVERSLPRGARMVFRETRKALFGEPPKKMSRSEINRQNAQRGWAKRKAAKKAAEEPSEPAISSLPVEAEISLVPDEPEIMQPGPVSELPLPEEPAKGNAISDQAATDSEEILLPIPDAAEHPDAEGSVYRVPIASCEDANVCKRDAKSASHLSTNKYKYKEKEKSLPPYPPHHAPNGRNSSVEGECKNLRAKFEELYKAYPKHEEPGRAWGAFLSLNPDEKLIAEIFKGLDTAKEQDRRFRSEYRYIPLLCNWISTEGWKSENTHHIMDPDAVRQGDSSRTSPYMYDRRPLSAREDIERRNIAVMRELKKRYGEPELS